MAVTKTVVLLALAITIVNAQRPFYAGSKPIGYPEIEQTEDLSNRFGDDSPLPAVVKGDRNLVNRLNKIPVDKQPFWFINWKQYEEARKKPQTWELNRSPFLDNQV